MENGKSSYKKVFKGLRDLSAKVKYIASGQLALDVAGAAYSGVEQGKPEEGPKLKTRGKGGEI